MTVRPSLAAVVLDFDGLVLDTETTLWRACSEQCGELGMRIDRDRYRSLIGAALPPEEFLRRILPHPVEVDLTALAAAVRARNQRLADAEDALPGVRALVDEAVAAAVPLAVASSSRREWVVGHLRRLGLLSSLSAVVCREDVDARKPAPDLHLSAARRLGARPEEILALEDSVIGAAGARAAGLRSVIVPGPLTSVDPDPAQARLPTLAGRGLAELAALVGLDPARPSAR
ncbi:HAD family hydrolase [Nocardia terpenica]|uniref:HAD-IA family hydrolase n=1 Tax=Nocardia terpenica TaxID=455432 RepID=A0A161WKX5_9NOCA|nr:HAD family phosphatase [Nocardia terpenica]KZM73715.1 hypothetical protein AWN90_34645 [Nocardia terpenica]NQE87045.1 HAD family phosphatase [Nocardia terpenica]